jgi:hypothetical protein
MECAKAPETMHKRGKANAANAAGRNQTAFTKLLAASPAQSFHHSGSNPSSWLALDSSIYSSLTFLASLLSFFAKGVFLFLVFSSTAIIPPKISGSVKTCFPSITCLLPLKIIFLLVTSVLNFSCFSSVIILLTYECSDFPMTHLALFQAGVESTSLLLISSSKAAFACCTSMV